MDQQRWKEIDAVFERMLEIEPGERADALAQMCAGDDDMRQRVEALLNQEEAAEDFLKSSAIAGLAGQMAEALGALTPGQRINHYHIESRIGVGGMGEVWKARDERLKREVAIKILPLEFSADPKRVRSFEQEAYTVSALNHPNIITIHEVGQNGELHFIVTEFIEGRTLRSYLRESDGAAGSAVSWREAVLIATQIAGALSAAHAAGVIHRDIKPENVMAQAGGHVKTLDFGIAKWVGAAASGGDGGDRPAGIETRLGVRPGTLKYMSPEQRRGEQLDARTDVFSLGLVLYEMIAGRHPYEGMSDEEIIEKLKSKDEIPPVSEANDAVPAALDRIVTKALRKRREDRYSSGGEMLADLERLKSLIEVGGEEKGERLLRAQNADQLLTQFVVFHDADRKTRIPLGALWTIRRFAGLKRGKLERELMRKSLISGLANAWWKILVIATITMLVAAWMSVNETWDERILRDGHTATVRRAAFSPDGKLLVSVGEDNKVIVWDFARRERLATFTDHQDRVTTVEFSPDGKWFATASADGSVIAWDAARLAKAAVLPGQRGVVRAIAFSADGRTLVTPTNDGRKNIWEVGSWKKLREVRFPGPGGGHFLLSPDGRWLMWPYGDISDLVSEQLTIDLRPYFWGGITQFSKGVRPPFWSWAAMAPDGRRIISIDAGGFVAFSETTRFSDPHARKLIHNHRAHHDNGRAVAFSPDGKLAASGAEDIVLWDAEARRKLARFKHQANVSSLAFSRGSSTNGRWLVSTHVDGAILIWDTVERELVADLNEHSASVGAVAFAPNGRRIASASEDDSVIVWDAARGVKEAALLWHPIRVNAVSFSADGKSLASSDIDGNLALWDVDGRRLRWAKREMKRVPAESSYCVTISPDGRWVATSFAVYESDEGHVVHNFRAELADSQQGIPQTTEIRGLAFSADGRWLIDITGRGEIARRRVGQWQVTDRVSANERRLVSLSLSPDGKMLVTGEDEGVAQLWRASPLEQIAVIGAHDARIKSVAFSPDGRTVASAGDDQMICLWNVAGRKLITRIGTHTSPVLSIAFSPDGKQLISGEHDHSVRLYTRRRALWGWPLD